MATLPDVLARASSVAISPATAPTSWAGPSGVSVAQTFADFELLVVDDGSTDATPEVLARSTTRACAGSGTRRTHGISRTRNTALGQARGEWLAFLDDDNEWAPDYLERQLAFAASRPGAGVVYCRARERDARTGSEVELVRLKQGSVFCDLVKGWNPFVSSALIRRSILLETGGFDERLRATEDRDMWLRLAQRTEFAGTSDALLIRHVRHGDQLSRNPDFLTRDAAILAAKWRDAMVSGCGRIAYLRWQLRRAVWAEVRRVQRAARQGGGGHLSAARLLRLLLEEAPHLAKALGLAMFGQHHQPQGSGPDAATRPACGEKSQLDD